MKVPNKQNFEAAEELRNYILGWKRIDKLLYDVFSTCAKNTDLDEVGYKVQLVDSLYNCQLPMDSRKSAKLIVNATIDEDLKTGDPVVLVERMAALRANLGSQVRRNNIGPVFASKYCHFHVPEQFAIYDKFAWFALKTLADRRIRERDYGEYKATIDELLSLASVVRPDLSYKELDEYLWIYGQWLAHRVKWQGKPVMWIEEADERELKLLRRLEPPTAEM
jgi:hypothetical protein